MKKYIISILCVLLSIILIDSIQALIFNNKPLISINSKGLFVTNYECNQGNVTKFSYIKYRCSNIKPNINDNSLEDYIKENLEKIHEVNSGISSSPYDYIDNEYYRNIVAFGEDVIPTLIDMYNKGSIVGLDASIAMLIIGDIKKCNIESNNTQEFFESYKNSVCDLGYVIVDESLDVDDFTCAQALEEFYQDDDYTYSFSCIKSGYIVVKYSNGDTLNIKDALSSNKIKISDLDKFNIKYYKEAR